jgi:hypothetical protein
MAKFFTQEATGGSRGGASGEDMERGFIEIGDEERKVWDDGDLWDPMPSGQGGFVGRGKGWER